MDLTQLRTDLRRLAIKQHVRMATNGGFVNNGRSCEVCKGEWADDAPEFHALTCTAIPFQNDAPNDPNPENIEPKPVPLA